MEIFRCIFECGHMVDYLGSWSGDILVFAVSLHSGSIFGFFFTYGISWVCACILSYLIVPIFIFDVFPVSGCNCWNFTWLGFFFLGSSVGGSTLVHKTTLVLHLSSRYVSGGLFLVYYSPCLIMCRFPIVVFIYFSILFFVNPSLRPGQVLSKPIFIYLRMLVVVELKSVTCKYCAGSSLVVWSIMLFTTIFDFFCLRGNFPHSCLFVSGAFYYL